MKWKPELPGQESVAREFCRRECLETIEGYDVVEKIGEGGMGQVYRAVHRRLDRPVAIKRLAPHLSHNQDMLKRFLQEARLQARLTHPNVVNIFDLIENDQGIFLVMEYVEGRTARDMIQERGRLSASEALMIAEGVLSGLAFMHKNGVVHRDIKPSNVMVSVDGTVKVTDFGIARLVNEETGLTRFGAGIGTLHYMAPELIKSGQVSFAIDIYSLGATLHELLAGAPPFVGNTDLEIMMGHLEKEPPRIDYLPRDEAGKACQKLIETALAKAPQDRFPSAEAFLADVRRIREMLARAPQPEVSPAGPGTRPAPGGGESRAEAGTRPVPPEVHASTGAAAAVVPPPPPQAKRDAGGDKATSPAPVIPPPDQASSLKRPAPETHAPAGKESAPTTGSPKKGRLGLVVGLGAAAVVAVVLFLVLRPGPTPSVPDPTKTAAPALTPQGVPSEKKAEPAAPAPAAETPPASPAPVVSQTPEAEKPAEPASQTPASPMPEDASPAASREAPAPVPVAETPPPAASEAQASPPAAPVAETPAPAPAAETPPASPSPAVAAASEAVKPTEPALPASEVSGPAPEAAPSATESASGTPPEKRVVYVGQAGARMREQPDTSSKILLTLDSGTRLIVLEDTGEWIKASEPDGQVGYISEKQTSAAPPAPSKVPPPPAKPASRKPAQKPAGDDQPGWRIVK